MAAHVKPVIIRGMSIGTGIPKICVPITGRTREEIAEAAKAIRTSPADFAEWRADYYESAFSPADIETLLVKLREILGEMPLLFTFRTKAEGGRGISYCKYEELLRFVASTGKADIIDVEGFSGRRARNLISTLKEEGTRVIGSYHDFAGTPGMDEIVRRLRALEDYGADIAKIAVMPQNEADVIMLLSATVKARQGCGIPIITMSMSRLGAISRVSGEVFGSSVTFGAIGEGSAPGQIEVRALRTILEAMH